MGHSYDIVMHAHMYLLAQDLATVASTETRQDWWLSNVRFNELYLVELRHVSQGSWQPVLCWAVGEAGL